MPSRPNTVSTTNGGAHCLAPLSHKKPKLKYNCKLDDLGAGSKIATEYTVGHV